MKFDVKNLGFMQGRLSPLQFNKIQAFPWEHWKDEFEVAHKIDLRLIEWTIDCYKFEDNPLFTCQDEIKNLMQRFKVSVESVTDDDFMENPPWKYESGYSRERILKIISAMGELGAGILVVPLVDNSSISNCPNLFELNYFLKDLQSQLAKSSVRIAFELDLSPREVEIFINNLDERYFGINYDVGNSASLGHSPLNEIKYYGNRIINVHIKDRILGGGSVQLGRGNADLKLVFEELHRIRYEGNYIFQTARSSTGNHEKEITDSKKFVENLILELEGTKS
jgi:hexulose-6-phosphate isomerase